MALIKCFVTSWQQFHASYQNTVYNAVSIPTIKTDHAIKPGETLNIEGSIFASRSPEPFSGLIKLIVTMIAMMTTNVIVILSIKAKSGNEPPDQRGRNFRTVDSGIVSKAPVRAAADVVRFQKNPKRKIASTPGEMKPTYSWINWYA